jgi:hypothetical protein
MHLLVVGFIIKKSVKIRGHTNVKKNPLFSLIIALHIAVQLLETSW